VRTLRIVRKRQSENPLPEFAPQRTEIRYYYSQVVLAEPVLTGGPHRFEFIAYNLNRNLYAAVQRGKKKKNPNMKEKAVLIYDVCHPFSSFYHRRCPFGSAGYWQEVSEGWVNALVYIR
jgi:hypothetical protein